MDDLNRIVKAVHHEPCLITIIFPAAPRVRERLPLAFANRSPQMCFCGLNNIGPYIGVTAEFSDERFNEIRHPARASQLAISPVLRRRLAKAAMEFVRGDELLRLNQHSLPGR
jgi:hypothetical protein